MKTKTLKTGTQFDEQVAICRDVFIAETHHDNAWWQILRPGTFTEQLFLKVEEGRPSEESNPKQFIDLINCSVRELIKLSLVSKNTRDNPLKVVDIIAKYDGILSTIKALMSAKNHDYGEAWRDMRPSSFTDLILMKLLRIKQIEINQGQTLVSEGASAGYQDIVNYSIFALIRMKEKSS